LLAINRNRGLAQKSNCCRRNNVLFSHFQGSGFARTCQRACRSLRSNIGLLDLVICIPTSK
jgi:hypothetical protein